MVYYEVSYHEIKPNLSKIARRLERLAKERRMLGSSLSHVEFFLSGLHDRATVRSGAVGLLSFCLSVCQCVIRRLSACTRVWSARETHWKTPPWPWESNPGYGEDRQRRRVNYSIELSWLTCHAEYPFGKWAPQVNTRFYCSNNPRAKRFWLVC